MFFFKFQYYVSDFCSACYFIFLFYFIFCQLMSIDTTYKQYRCTPHLVPQLYPRLPASPSSHTAQTGFVSFFPFLDRRKVNSKTC